MDNAAARDNFVSGLYEQAVSQEKQFVLKELVAPEFSRLHREAAIHLHDLEGYRFVYNCCTPSLETTLAPERFASHTDETKMVEIFEKLKNLITNLAVCQTGGIGFANFDGDIAATLTNLNIPCQDSNRALMTELTALFIRWVNVTRTRYCREPYYISLNIGLMKVPEPLRDYVIIHELAHINHMDHSAEFWAEVGSHDPLYKRHRKQLQQFSPGV